MRGDDALAARLGVVPGALYRHVRSKEQLYDLVLDDVLAEVEALAAASGYGPETTVGEQIDKLRAALAAAGPGR